MSQEKLALKLSFATSIVYNFKPVVYNFTKMPLHGRKNCAKINRSISTKNVASELNTTLRTVQQVLKRYSESGTTWGKCGSGRMLKFLEKLWKKTLERKIQIYLTEIHQNSTNELYKVKKIKVISRDAKARAR